MSNIEYKICPNCGEIWKTQDDLLSDVEVQIVGYQANYAKLGQGLFLFNHLTCGTTLAIKVGSFENLYNGPRYDKALTGSTECPSYCMYHEVLAKCANQCECSYVREILQILKNWDKKEDPKFRDSKDNEAKIYLPLDKNLLKNVDSKLINGD